MARSNSSSANASLPSASISVGAASAELLPEARALAEELGIPLRDAPNKEAKPAERNASPALLLRFDHEGLSLTDGAMSVKADFSRSIKRLRQPNLSRELIVRAAKTKRSADSPAEAPLAIDATAGFGEDALLLAAAGFQVIMFERDPIIAALLEDGLKRAASDPALASIAARMTLRKEDSALALQHPDFQADVVVLDPMFPERQKSAAVKKKFQLLHHLEQPCEDEDALLAAAFAANPKKIVIKRPIKGPHLGGIKPAYSLSGKAVRYDCLLPASTSR